MPVPAPDAPRPPLELAALAASAGPDWTVRLLAEAGSTNALAAAEPLRNLVVVADHQTAGRGRLERVWTTPPGAALTFSAVVDPVVDDQWWPLVPLAAGLAVARAIRPRRGVWPRLKWPNDVLIGGAKVSGILVERVHVRAHGGQKPLAVVGIGINVDQGREELPVDTATSLALAGQTWDRTELFGEVLRALRFAIGRLAGSPSSLVASYRGMSATLDQQVRVELPGGKVLEGRALDVDDHGALVVQTGEAPSPDGPPMPGRRPGPGDAGVVVVGAGDVVHVRGNV